MLVVNDGIHESSWLFKVPGSLFHGLCFIIPT